uniref:EGF-like domain-containing protein n=1 Tax=Romanomermis culicivorax TaxID=13658 RepID=A0A915JVZ2_ROMCU
LIATSLASDLCKLHCNEHNSDKFVEKFCSKAGYDFSQNCCYKDGINNGTVVGVDLSNCNLTNIGKDFFTEDASPRGKNFEVVDLTDNQLSGAVISNDSWSATCPEHSTCLDYGPGRVQCRCMPGRYGYKCLKTDTKTKPMQRLTFKSEIAEKLATDKKVVISTVRVFFLIQYTFPSWEHSPLLYQFLYGRSSVDWPLTIPNSANV